MGVFGKELYRSVRLRDIRFWPGRSNNQIRRTLLSFVEVLYVDWHGHRHERIACTGIAKLCVGLRVLILPEGGSGCGKKQPCGCLPQDRAIKLVLRGRQSPLVAVPRSPLTSRNPMNWYRQPNLDRSPGFTEAMIEFDANRACFSPRSNKHEHSPFTAEASMQKLSLVFRPTVKNDMWFQYDYDRTRRHCRSDDSEPQILSGTGLPLDRNDLCSHLAMACLSAPRECSIYIVNIDQLPVWIKGATFPRLGPVRSSTGLAMELVHFSRVGFGRGYDIIAPRDAEHHHSLEEQLRQRVNTVRNMTKRWLGAFMIAAGTGDTLDKRWNNIEWVTLKEYLDMPGKEDDFSCYPDWEKWI